MFSIIIIRISALPRWGLMSRKPQSLWGTWAWPTFCSVWSVQEGPQRLKDSNHKIRAGNNNGDQSIILKLEKLKPKESKDLAKVTEMVSNGMWVEVSWSPVQGLFMTSFCPLGESHYEQMVNVFRCQKSKYGYKRSTEASRRTERYEVGFNQAESRGHCSCRGMPSTCPECAKVGISVSGKEVSRFLW